MSFTIVLPPKLNSFKTPVEKQHPVITDLVIVNISARLNKKSVYRLSCTCKKVFQHLQSLLYEAKLGWHLRKINIHFLLDPKHTIENNIQAFNNVQILNKSLILAFNGICNLQAIPVIKHSLLNKQNVPIARGIKSQAAFIAFRYVIRHEKQGNIVNSEKTAIYYESRASEPFIDRVLMSLHMLNDYTPLKRGSLVIDSLSQILVGNNGNFNIDRLKRLITHQPVGINTRGRESDIRILSNGKSKVELI